MTALRFPLLAGLAALPLAACVASNPSAQRATELATTVSRATACRAGTPPRGTLERFIETERARGASAEQIAGARSTYVTVSEAETVNQSVQPKPCDQAERAALAQRMAAIRSGDFGGR